LKKVVRQIYIVYSLELFKEFEKRRGDET